MPGNDERLLLQGSASQALSRVCVKTEMQTETMEVAETWEFGPRFCKSHTKKLSQELAKLIRGV